jgi:DNA-binding winged helix-turn-helix (wHTH) protein
VGPIPTGDDCGPLGPCRLVTAAIGLRGGYIFGSGGDGFAAAFASASDAAAAVDAQRRLVAQRWPEGAPIRVRRGLHTGTAQERDGDYFGTVVNRAARIGAAGHGGQVLVSAATAELLADDEWSLVDLGEHRLKGLTRAERLFQLRAEGMAEVDLPVRLAGSGAALRLLGGVEAVVVDGRSVTLGGQRQRAILALLAIEVGRVVSVERLIDSVWGEAPPETVRASLQVHISQLRRAFTDAGLPGAIETRPPGYVLVLDREAIDLHRFPNDVEQARAAAYSGNIAEAGRLARSALAEFAGMSFAGLRDLAWAEAVALHVGAQRLDMIELAADADLAAGRQ